ncbi:MAG TPA: caspase family protein, partial [Pseudoxanthomonas mexicana]|nr:caspase family protein [Pseudoxanthomonas mexicana]
MATALRILCVHGVGQHPPGGAWQQAWEAAIHEACRQVDAERALDIQYCHYDDIFAQHKVGLGDTLEALARLLANGITAPFRRARGDDSRLRHTAGMVVKWVESPTFRKQTRDRLVERIEAVKPHVVLGHSLGSLVCYDTFTHEESRATASGRYFVSLGSQIGNPFVRGEYQAGRLSAIEKARFWYHLYNRFDSVFTARVSIAADNFRQVDTHFDIPGNADHAAEEYLRHPQAVSTFWYDVLNDETARITRALREQRPVSARVATPRKRALLIGINDYPDPDQRLAGCVNDVFLMSAMLQEQGFDAGDIRVVLDERATADGIRERV